MPRVRKAILVIGNDISSVRSEVDFPTIYSLYFFFGFDIITYAPKKECVLGFVIMRKEGLSLHGK